MNRLPCAVALLAIAVWIASRPGDAAGCGGAYRPGERVDVADETALIVWDARTHTQHFIRRATFLSTGYDFGFLVPTPNRPELAESSDDLFTELAELTAPKVEYRTVNGLGLACGGGSAPSPDGGRFLPSGGVVVLEQKRVGGFDAAVLAFRPGTKNDPAAGAAELAAWLKSNDYVFTPGLLAWLEPYVRDGWVVTAFKIAGEPKPQDTPAPKSGSAPTGKTAINLGARPVRMSFKTDRPFFPYREPEDQRDEQAKSVPRLLRVFVAAPSRFAGKLGDGTKAWPGKTVWAGPVETPQWGDVFRHAQMTKAPVTDGWWLTEFEDRSMPRPGTDEVYFEPSPDLSPVYRRPAIVTVERTPVWLGVLCCGTPVAFLVLCLVGLRRLVRSK
ncbi:DUF2330 domain-containing protein [Frigoriglobus tundricola]|uniref:DUF2330 domain-containing protein n=1 Tax=Frigoriglobus tundricola TaxID=2774151 RepID=A0A6M5YUT3_9BACT|nr:DUF2330 domain-containing protein [Frigoriglobus tundricola]QJW97857.1 hypothetical protein FTUN_5437 [Frigoriglobus tundricola]